MRLAHRQRTSATPAQVWEVLGDPARWPEFEPFLRRVRGTRGRASSGQVLVGIARVGGLGVPIDVVEAHAPDRLVLRISLAPGVTQTVVHEVLPVVTGGSDLRVSVVVEGLFARPAALPLWLSTGLTTRLLAVRAERLARSARRAA